MQFPSCLRNDDFSIKTAFHREEVQVCAHRLESLTIALNDWKPRDCQETTVSYADARKRRVVTSRMVFIPSEFSLLDKVGTSVITSSERFLEANNVEVAQLIVNEQLKPFIFHVSFLVLNGWHPQVKVVR